MKSWLIFYRNAFKSTRTEESTARMHCNIHSSKSSINDNENPKQFSFIYNLYSLLRIEHNKLIEIRIQNCKILNFSLAVHKQLRYLWYLFAQSSLKPSALSYLSIFNRYLLPLNLVRFSFCFLAKNFTRNFSLCHKENPFFMRINIYLNPASNKPDETLSYCNECNKSCTSYRYLENFQNSISWVKFFFLLCVSDTNCPNTKSIWFLIFSDSNSLTLKTPNCKIEPSY